MEETRLRWIIRDGNKVLQIYREVKYMGEILKGYWMDIPMADESQEGYPFMED